MRSSCIRATIGEGLVDDGPSLEEQLGHLQVPIQRGDEEERAPKVLIYGVWIASRSPRDHPQDPPGLPETPQIADFGPPKLQMLNGLGVVLGRNRDRHGSPRDPPNC